MYVPTLISDTIHRILANYPTHFPKTHCNFPLILFGFSPPHYSPTSVFPFHLSFLFNLSLFPLCPKTGQRRGHRSVCCHHGNSGRLRVSPTQHASCAQIRGRSSVLLLSLLHSPASAAPALRWPLQERNLGHLNKQIST